MQAAKVAVIEAYGAKQMDFSPSVQPEFLALREKALNAAAGLSRSERLILRLLLARRGTPVARSEICLATIGLFDSDAATFQLSEAIEHINAALRAAGVSESIVLNADGGARLVN